MFRFNDNSLDDILKVIEISTTLISDRENYKIDISSRNGLVYNGYKYNEKKIKIVADLKASNAIEYERLKNMVCDILDTEEPAQLYVQKGRFFYAVIDGEIAENKITAWYGRLTMTFVCFVPFAYSDEVKQFDLKDNIIAIENRGNATTYPVFSFTPNNDCHFIQLENLNNGKKMLIGQIPVLGKESTPASKRIFHDVMESTTGWVTTSANIDVGRAIGGTLAVAANGDGLTCGDFGSTSSGSQWHGVCVRKNLSTTVKNFEINLRMKHNSTGKNGDPTVMDAKKEEVKKGVEEQIYQVSVWNLNMRTGPSTSYKSIGYAPLGHKITNYTMVGKWIKFKYNGSTVYVYSDYCKKITVTNTVTETKENMMVISTTQGQKEVVLRSGPHHTSKAVTTIKIGEVLRVISSKIYEDVYVTEKDDNGKPTQTKVYKYYKLAKPYNGYNGYFSALNLAKAEDVTIEYDYSSDAQIADDKTGVVEVYGFSANSVRLFKCMLCDDNKYYEFTYPTISIGGDVILQDITIAPEPIKKKIYDVGSDRTVTQREKTFLSGKYGSWNEFYGNMKVRRESGGKWYLEVQRIIDGQITKEISKTTTSSSYPTDDLAYLVIYMGTNGEQAKASGLAVTDIKIDDLSLSATDPGDTNIMSFQAGDSIVIDCHENTVKHNNSNGMYLIDVGSSFFGIDPGNTEIKITTDDKELVGNVVFNERYL